MIQLPEFPQKTPLEKRVSLNKGGISTLCYYQEYLDYLLSQGWAIRDLQNLRIKNDIIMK